MTLSDANTPQRARSAACEGQCAAAPGSDGVLIANAAATFVREEIAHALAVPISFFHLLVGELEAGQTPARDRIDIAREEIARLRRMVAGLRATPEWGAAPEPVRLASIVGACCAEIVAGSAGGLEFDVRIASSIVVRADPATLRFAVHAAVAALAARGARRMTIDATIPAAPCGAAKLSIEADAAELGERPLSAVRAWMDSDRHAIAFAVARRMARASEMHLRHEPDAHFRVGLEIPIAVVEE